MKNRTQPMPRRALKVILMAGCMVATGLAIVGTAVAQSTPASSSNDIWSRPTLTGDWGGARTKLSSIGIDTHGFYVGDFADVLSGGNRQGNGYAQQFGFGADVNLGKLAGLDGAVLHLNFNARQGRSVSGDFIGNRLAAQEVYGAGETFRIVEMDYEQTFANGAADTKVGFFPVGNDFANTPALCAFENVGFCSHPQNLPASSGWSDYPTGKWGGRLKINPTPNLYLETGLFDVNPGYYDHTNGLKVSLSGSTGVLIPVEVGLTTAFGPAKLPGQYKIGAYYDTSSVSDPVLSNRVDNGRYGGYLLADQMLFSFDGTPNRGLIGFLQYSYSDTKTSVFSTTYLAALIAQGPFAARPHDYAEIGFVRAGINHRVINAETARQINAGIVNPALAEGENVVEAGYGIQATPWLIIHPDVQYIDQPGAFAYKHIPNAWVFGSEIKVQF